MCYISIFSFERFQKNEIKKKGSLEQKKTNRMASSDTKEEVVASKKSDRSKWFASCTPENASLRCAYTTISLPVLSLHSSIELVTVAPKEGSSQIVMIACKQLQTTSNDEMFAVIAEYLSRVQKLACFASDAIFVYGIDAISVDLRDRCQQRLASTHAQWKFYNGPFIQSTRELARILEAQAARKTLAMVESGCEPLVRELRTRVGLLGCTAALAVDMAQKSVDDERKKLVASLREELKGSSKSSLKE